MIFLMFLLRKLPRNTKKSVLMPGVSLKTCPSWSAFFQFASLTITFHIYFAYEDPFFSEDGPGVACSGSVQPGASRNHIFVLVDFQPKVTATFGIIWIWLQETGSSPSIEFVSRSCSSSLLSILECWSKCCGFQENCSTTTTKTKAKYSSDQICCCSLWLHCAGSWNSIWLWMPPLTCVRPMETYRLKLEIKSSLLKKPKALRTGGLVG